MGYGFLFTLQWAWIEARYSLFKALMVVGWWLCPEPHLSRIRSMYDYLDTDDAETYRAVDQLVTSALYRGVQQGYRFPENNYEIARDLQANVYGLRHLSPSDIEVHVRHWRYRQAKIENDFHARNGGEAYVRPAQARLLAPPPEGVSE